jgi:hypothetical protein
MNRFWWNVIWTLYPRRPLHRWIDFDEMLYERYTIEDRSKFVAFISYNNNAAGSPSCEVGAPLAQLAPLASLPKWGVHSDPHGKYRNQINHVKNSTVVSLCKCRILKTACICPVTNTKHTLSLNIIHNYAYKNFLAFSWNHFTYSVFSHF